MRATYVNFFDVKINQMFYYRELSGLCVKSSCKTFVNSGIEYTVQSDKVLCIIYVA